jgi:hypothetical protein
MIYMQKLLEELMFGLSCGVKPSRAMSGAGWYGHTAVTAVRAETPVVFTKGQDGTLGIQTHPLNFRLLIFFLFTFLQGSSFTPSFHHSTIPVF